MLTATADPFPMTLLPSSSNGGDCPILLFAANLPTTSDTTHVGIIMCGTVRYNTLFLNVGRRAEQLDGRRDHGPSTQEMSLVIFGRRDGDFRSRRVRVCVVRPSPPSVRKPPSLSERLAFRDYEPTLSLSCSNRLEGFGEPLYKLIRQLATVEAFDI